MEEKWKWERQGQERLHSLETGGLPCSAYKANSSGRGRGLQTVGEGGAEEGWVVEEPDEFKS